MALKVKHSATLACLNVYNLVGYYEKGPASVRLSYNYREKYYLELRSVSSLVLVM